MGPTQRSGLLGSLNRWQSLASRLFTHSRCPVWSVGEHPDSVKPRGPIQRILCAVSGRDSQVLSTAAELSRSLNARLFLLNVVLEISESTLAYVSVDRLAPTTREGMRMLAGMQEGTYAQPIVEVGTLNGAIRRPDLEPISVAICSMSNACCVGQQHKS